MINETKQNPGELFGFTKQKVNYDNQPILAKILAETKPGRTISVCYMKRNETLAIYFSLRKETKIFMKSFVVLSTETFSPCLDTNCRGSFNLKEG